MQVLKQSTASQVVYVYLTDATDGFTPEVGVSSPTVYLSKNGGEAAVPESLAWAETDGTNMPGFYEITLSAVDSNTVGPLAIDVIKTGTSRHFAVVCYVSAALLDTIKTDTAAILADTGTDGVVIPAATQAAIVDAVLDEVNTSGAHNVTNSVGAQLRAMTSAADPWAVDLPAAYVAGQAGYEIGRAIQGAGAGVGTVTVQDEDDVALSGVRVDIYTSATLVDAAHYWTGGTTNTSGVFTFYAPVGTYYARRYKQGYGFTSDPVTVTVS